MNRLRAVSNNERQSRGLRAGDVSMLEDPDDEDVADESQLDAISDAEVLAAVNTLEAPLREVVELCYLQQKRYREAAAILDIPIGTVATRMRRARDKLRSLLVSAQPLKTRE